MAGKQHEIRIAHFCLGTALLLATTSSGHADPQELNDYRLYSQPLHSNHLIRYRFSDHTVEDVGTVTLPSGTTVSNIDALAHVPHNTNLFAFWQDPSDQLTKLLYVNSHDASAKVVGHDLGAGRVTGAVAVKPQHGDTLGSNQPTPIEEVQQHELFGVQEGIPVRFEITRDEVVPLETFAAKVTVLGAAISYGGQYDMPVTAQFMIGGSVVQPFGGLTRALAGNVNDGNNPRSYVFNEIHSAATPINIVARSWKKKRYASGTSEKDWQPFISASSNQNNGGIITLRNGDPVPDITPLQNQSSIVDFIDDYIDSGTNKVVLNANQAIYLFELGTTNFNSNAADYQDLVVLVTLAKDPEHLIEHQNLPVAHLIQIDPRTGGTEIKIALERVYDSLTAISSEKFYASSKGSLYEIDLVEATETLIGSSNDVKVGELGATHNTVWGFGNVLRDEALLDLSHGFIHDMPNGLNHAHLDPVVLVREVDVAVSLISFD